MSEVSICFHARMPEAETGSCSGARGAAKYLETWAESRGHKLSEVRVPRARTQELTRSSNYATTEKLDADPGSLGTCEGTGNGHFGCVDKKSAEQ